MTRVTLAALLLALTACDWEAIDLRIAARKFVEDHPVMMVKGEPIEIGVMRAHGAIDPDWVHYRSRYGPCDRTEWRCL